MRTLELLAPARNLDIGIAAIDCGADAVYIGGPAFGARKDAGNSIEDIAALCSYAHKFGVRIYMTVNTVLEDDELQEVHSQMLLAQEAGVDAFIIRDTRICGWKDITVPLHASTQCAIRDAQRAGRFVEAGCSRLVLERELSLETVRELSAGVDAEIEFFVHGALCVCYSGDCRLSEYIDGRSADKGACIQACRSLYDLVDESGKVLVRNKALLSLRDLDLHSRLADLAEAGVDSFKIEGRLKNISFVRNITRWYSKALDALVEANPSLYRRASFGRVVGGFEPDPAKTFNRGYTDIFIDGKRGRWACTDAPKSMGERIGTVLEVRRSRGQMSVRLKADKRDTAFSNGDGFAFVRKDAIVGFRADRCEGNILYCKDVPSLKEGTILYRNVSAAFEKELDSRPCSREIPVALDVRISGKWSIDLNARTADGRVFESRYKADLETAENRERAESMIRGQLSKKSLHYTFTVETLEAAGALPLLSASTLNEMRRLLAQDLDSLPCGRIPLKNTEERKGVEIPKQIPEAQLMRSKYCIKYELGLCPVHQGARATGDLFLVNNGRKLALGFDCKVCEMTVSVAPTPGRK